MEAGLNIQWVLNQITFSYSLASVKEMQRPWVVI